MASGAGVTGGTSAPNYLVLVLVFVTSRLVLLPLPPLASDVGIYARYIWESAAGGRRGESFYEFHAREIEAWFKRGR